MIIPQYIPEGFVFESSESYDEDPNVHHAQFLWGGEEDDEQRIALHVMHYFNNAVPRKIGIPTDEREFHCRGEFKGANKGRPDANDLAAAKAWAMTLK